QGNDDMISGASCNCVLTTRQYAVYPGTLTVASLTGNIDIRTRSAPPGVFIPDVRTAPAIYNPTAPTSILMAPTPSCQLSILAGGDIGPTKIAMLDMDPYFLPGLFTLGGNAVVRNSSMSVFPQNVAYQWGSVGFPFVEGTLSDSGRKRQHASTPTHASDSK